MKEALIISSDEEAGRTFDENIGVARRTRGIIFLGTPHSTDLERLSSQIHLITLTDSPSGGETIGMDVRAVIWQIFQEFTNLSSLKPPWQIISFYEELPVADEPGFGPVSYQDQHARFSSVLSLLTASSLGCRVERYLSRQTTTNWDPRQPWGMKSNSSCVKSVSSPSNPPYRPLRGSKIPIARCTKHLKPP